MILYCHHTTQGSSHQLSHSCDKIRHYQAIFPENPKHTREKRQPQTTAAAAFENILISPGLSHPACALGMSPEGLPSGSSVYKAACGAVACAILPKTDFQLVLLSVRIILVVNTPLGEVFAKQPFIGNQ